MANWKPVKGGFNYPKPNLGKSNKAISKITRGQIKSAATKLFGK
jgi:hypothetical protein